MSTQPISLGPFGSPQPQPNPQNQSMYQAALKAYRAAITNLVAAIPGLLQAYQTAKAAVMATGMDTNGAMDAAWIAYQAAEHALTSDSLTYSDQLFGWYETWYLNAVPATAPPPALPASLAAYVANYAPIAALTQSQETSNG